MIYIFLYYKNNKYFYICWNIQKYSIIIKYARIFKKKKCCYNLRTTKICKDQWQKLKNIKEKKVHNCIQIGTLLIIKINLIICSINIYLKTILYLSFGTYKYFYKLLFLNSIICCNIKFILLFIYLFIIICIFSYTF